MPTGYTAVLYDGEQSFEDFAWGVARGFGALVTLRDEPDAEIPEEFQPDTRCHDDALARARETLRELDRMTGEEAAKRAAAEYDAEIARRRKDEQKRAAIRDRYEAMLRKVAAWTPPTADHINLKEMMVEQLRKAIDFDCKSYKRRSAELLTAQEWVDKQREDALRDLDYHTGEREKAIERARARTEWTQALRESLADKAEVA